MIHSGGFQKMISPPDKFGSLDSQIHRYTHSGYIMDHIPLPLQERVKYHDAIRYPVSTGDVQKRQGGGSEDIHAFLYIPLPDGKVIRRGGNSDLIGENRLTTGRSVRLQWIEPLFTVPSVLTLLISQPDGGVSVMVMAERSVPET